MSADSIVAFGVNHKVAPVAVREQLTCGGDYEQPLRTLQAIPGCGECFFLTTCNRVETLFVCADGGETEKAVTDFLFGDTNLSSEQIKQYSFLHRGRAAVHHLFRVASSLDSMIVGEPQILGQLKQAFREASDRGATGVILSRLFNKAFFVAKRVRTETNIGGSAVSISYAAVQLAKKILGNLEGKKVLLLGAGEMAELAAEHLVAQGIDEVVVANRTFERAVALAANYKGRAIAFDELVGELETVDILISSTGAPGLVLRSDEVKPIMRQRLNRPLFLIDIAVPRDLDPTLHELDNVYLYDIDDLTNVVDVNKQEREVEAARAEHIVEEETGKFLQWLEGMEMTPTIVALREKAAAVCRGEVEKTLANLGQIGDREQKSIEKMAAAIANKLLHDATLYLKKDASGEDKRQRLAVVRQVFGLDNNGGDPGDQRK